MVVEAWLQVPSFLILDACVVHLSDVFVHALTWRQNTRSYILLWLLWANKSTSINECYLPRLLHSGFYVRSGKRDTSTMKSRPPRQPNATRPECCVKERTSYSYGTWKMGFRTWSTTLNNHWSMNQSSLSAGEHPQSWPFCGSHLFR